MISGFTLVESQKIMPLVVLEKSIVMNSKRQLTRRQKAIRNNVSPVFALILIVAIAAGFTWLVTEPVSHPNRHPRLVRFYNEFQRFHPRLAKVVLMSPLALYISLIFLKPMLPLVAEHNQVKKRLQSMRKQSGETCSSMRSAQDLPLELKSAWAWLADSLPGMQISAPGIRETGWRLLQKNEAALTMTVMLNYCHNHTGVNSSQMYPRLLTCVARLSGAGTSSFLTLEYAAQSAMDHTTVQAIIDKTNAALEAAAVDYCFRLSHMACAAKPQPLAIELRKTVEDVAVLSPGNKLKVPPAVVVNAHNAPTVGVPDLEAPPAADSTLSSNNDALGVQEVAPGVVPGYEFFTG